MGVDTRALSLLTLGFLMQPGAPMAESVYKSTDESGTITYSDEIPKDAVSSEAVPIPSTPSPEDQAEAQARSDKLINRADDLTRRRLEHNQKLLEEREKTRRAALEKAPASSNQNNDSGDYFYPWYGPGWGGGHRPPPVKPPKPGPKPYPRPPVRATPLPQ